ncbi:hypothetical protein EDD85DRAFT_783833 [Armillaria nabsnona]|nr:hypothetical protein EDD85DRAFT_783833 [Armillaria nabsnona]
MWAILEIVLTAAILGVSLVIYLATLTLAFLYCLGIYPRPWHVQTDNHSLQSLDLHVLPRQPPAVHHGTPVSSCRASTLDEYPRFNWGNQENLPGEVQVGVQERGDGNTARARLPFIQLSPETSRHLSAGNTPCPTWQGTSSDSGWERQAREVLPLPSNLPAAVLGLPQQIHQPRPSLAFSGPMPTSPTRLSSLDEVIPIGQESQQRSSILNLPLSQSPVSHQSSTDTQSPVIGISPYRSPSNLPPHQESRHRNSSSDRQTSSMFHGDEFSLPKEPEQGEQQSLPPTAMSYGAYMGERGDKQSESELPHLEKSTNTSRASGSIAEGKPIDASTETLPAGEYINGIIGHRSPPPSPAPTPQIPDTPPADHPNNHL